MRAALIITPVFILIGIGWFLRRMKWLSPQTIKENNLFLYWCAIPATLLRGILSAGSDARQSPAFLAAVWSPYVITMAAAWLASRRKESGRFAAIVLCSVRGNSFFAGLPVVSLAMGRRGAEAGTLILAFSLAVMQMISIGGAQFALSGSVSRRTIKTTCVQLLKNPLFMTCFLGLTLAWLGFGGLPKWLDETLSILADVSTGLALIVLGAGLRLENFFKSAASVWEIIVFKLIVFPAVTYIVFAALGFSGDLLQAGVLLASMPVAVNSSIIAQEMGLDSSYCAMAIAVSTLFSMLTLPLLIQVLGLA